MNYIKGNWKPVKYNLQYPDQEIRIYTDDGLIATMNGVTNVRTGQSTVTLPQEANANLISAAPELYEALKAIMLDDDLSSSLESSVWEQASEALAKAEGK